MRPPHLAAALATLLLAACDRGGADAVASWQTVTDTIGDTVVVRTVGASDSAATLRLVADLRIGELEGADEYTFGRIGALHAAPDGGVYVWDAIARSLRHYDSAGTYVRQIARRGGGPGEYEQANGMVMLRDGRLVLWDPRNGRLNLYDASGGNAGSWQSPSSLFTGQRAMYADTVGNVAVLAWLRDDAPSGELGEPEEALIRVGPDGNVRDTLRPPVPEVPDAPLIGSGGGMTVFQRVPFTPNAVWSFTPAGEFVTARTDRYAITMHRAGGPLRIEREIAPVGVQPDEADDARAFVTGQIRRADPGWRWNATDVPDVKPFFAALLVADDGRLWVQRTVAGERIPDEEYDELVAGQPRITPPPPAPRRWREPAAYDVFAPDGRFLGHLPVPPRTMLHHTRGDTIWAVQRDSLDVPYVVRFRVEPSLGARADRP